jgi:hypothetical protein
MEMKHPEAEGVQRVRCYPFKTHLFQARNLKEPVFFLPVKDYMEDFSLPEDKEKLEYGRVHLLFSVLIPSRMGKVHEHDLAFIKYLKPFEIKGEHVFLVSLCMFLVLLSVILCCTHHHMCYLVLLSVILCCTHQHMGSRHYNS